MLSLFVLLYDFIQMMADRLFGSVFHRAFARFIYFPSIVRMMVMEGPKRRWYDRVDDTVILGALPFRSQTKQVKLIPATPRVHQSIHHVLALLVQLVETENVRAVLSFNEPYELELFTNSHKARIA